MSVTCASSFRPAQTVIMVGEPHLAERLRDIAHSMQSPVRIELDPRTHEEEAGHFFCRDMRVVGINQMHILPYAIKELDVEVILAMLPESSNYVIVQEGKALTGFGFAPEYVALATEQAKSYGIPFKQARSTIEGGNCFVFVSEGKRKAIVGIHSLITTLIGLKEQGYFAEHEEKIEKLVKEIEHPSDHAIRIARNLNYYHSYAREFQAGFSRCWKPDYQKFLANITSPLSAEDRSTYHDRACQWEARIRLAREVMAEDLCVPLEGLAIVPQDNFHIDMEMSVPPEGSVVFLHSDVATMQTAGLSDQIRLEAQKNHLRVRNILIEQVRAISQIGCPVKIVPAVLGGAEIPPVYLLNGIYLPGIIRHVFISAAPCERDSAFTELFKKHFPIPCVDIEGLDKIAAEDAGSIHCLTWEWKEVTAPLDRVSTFLADEPYLSQECRAALADAIPWLK